MAFDFKNIHQAKLTLALLNTMDAECNHDIDQLLADFQTTHSDPPARLTRIKGRVLCWRRKARVPAEQSIFTLTGSMGQQFLASLPALVQYSFCEFEQRRLDLCARKKTVAHEVFIITHWIKARKTLREMTNSSKLQ